MHTCCVSCGMSIHAPSDPVVLNTDTETSAPPEAPNSAAASAANADGGHLPGHTDGDDIGNALDALLREAASAAPAPARKLPVHVPVNRKAPLRLDSNGADSSTWFDDIVLPEEDKSSAHLEALLISQHRRVLTTCPRTIEAFRSVLESIHKRSAPVNHAASSVGAPFTARDVTSRSAALDEKLPVLVLARRLEILYAHSVSGLELFDHPVRPAPSRDNRVASALFDASRAQAARFAAVATLLRPVVESMSSYLVVDSPSELFAHIGEALSLGIETGRWSKLHPALKDIADLLTAASNNVAPLIGTLENGRLLRLAAVQQAQAALGLRN